MKISKIFAGMSALALSAAVVASVTASAEEFEANKFYPANGSTSGTYTYTYTGDQLTAAIDNGLQLSENKDEETGTSTWTCGMNIQVGHMTNAKVTMIAKSSANNIYKGADAEPGSEDYLWTVQASWNADAPADMEEGTVKYTEDTKKGATELNGWDSGAGKFNGQWAQFMLTDDNLSAVTIEVTVDVSGSTWEYHEFDPEKSDDDNAFIIFNMMGSPSTITEKAPYEEIFKKAGSDDSNASGTDSKSSGTDSKNSGTDSKSSGTDSKTTSNGGGTTSKAGGTNGGNSTKSTSTAGNTTSATSDNTANAESGAAAGIGLAIAALAGAAIVVSRKK